MATPADETEITQVDAGLPADGADQPQPSVPPPATKAAKKTALKKAAPAKRAPVSKRAAPSKTTAEASDTAEPGRARKAPARRAAPSKAAADPEPPAAKKAPTRKATSAKAAKSAGVKKVAARKLVSPPSGPDVASTGEAYAEKEAGSGLGGGEVAAGRTHDPQLRGLFARLADHPGSTPELLALAAVEVLGPRAAEWARRLREAYPQADADGLARLASAQFLRQATLGGAGAALAGSLAPVVGFAVVLWSQANLVLHLAAAYDRDPTHADRAAELLVLTLVHPDLATARSALAAARSADGPHAEPAARVTEAAWRLAAPLTAQAGGWLALRLAARLIPGAAPLAAAAGTSAAVQRLTARAVASYRPHRNVS